VKKQITLFPRGGLGNQLFQYGAAVNLSRKFGVPIVVDDVLLKSGVNRRYFNPVKLELNSFQNELVFEAKSKGIPAKVRSRILALQRLLGDRFPQMPISIKYFASEKKENLTFFQTLKSPVNINSYCGSPLFFGDYADEICKNISQIIDPSEWLTKIIIDISSSKPIGLNVRLGDYKNLTHIYGKFDISYYLRSLELVKKISGHSKVWLFSDEPELAKELFAGQIQFERIVSIPTEFRPIEYLVALSNCEAIICANSSFSWWAAFLAQYRNPDVKVVFPRPMFANPQISEPFNWLPSNWLTVGRILEV